jgi:hypothetical protein
MDLIADSWEHYAEEDWRMWILELILPEQTISSAITRYEKTPSGRLYLFPEVFPGYPLPIPVTTARLQKDRHTGRLYFTVDHFDTPMQYCLIPPTVKAASS